MLRYLYNIVHQPRHIFKYLVVDLLEQVIVAAIGRYLESVVNMAGTKWPGGH